MSMCRRGHTYTTKKCTKCTEYSRTLRANGEEPINMVPIEPLRDYFLRSGLTLNDVARGMEWTRSSDSRKLDGGRVSRMLGLRDEISDGRATRRNDMGYDLAVDLARAMGADPVDVGV